MAEFAYLLHTLLGMRKKACTHLYRAVCLSGRHMEAFGEELEVVDERFHRLLHVRT